MAVSSGPGGPEDYEPTPTDFVIDKLGGVPSQDGLYLCERGCGVVLDSECAYGGWHDDSQALVVDFFAKKAR